MICMICMMIVTVSSQNLGWPTVILALRHTLLEV